LIDVAVITDAVGRKDPSNDVTVHTLPNGKQKYWYYRNKETIAIQTVGYCTINICTFLINYIRILIVHYNEKNSNNQHWVFRDGYF